MTKLTKFNLAETKALLARPPVLATELDERFERIFDQVVRSLHVEDAVELILVREFTITSWEIERYTRHRTIAFDRKVKDTLQVQLQQLKEQKARRQARIERFAEDQSRRPSEVAYLLQLEHRALEGLDVEMNEILNGTPSELSYNLALEKGIALHKDLEVLITSITKRRNEALAMLERYRQGLGKGAKDALEEILRRRIPGGRGTKRAAACAFAGRSDAEQATRKWVGIVRFEGAHCWLMK